MRAASPKGKRAHFRTHACKATVCDSTSQTDHNGHPVMTRLFGISMFDHDPCLGCLRNLLTRCVGIAAVSCKQRGLWLWGRSENLAQFNRMAPVATHVFNCFHMIVDTCLHQVGKNLTAPRRETRTRNHRKDD